MEGLKETGHSERQNETATMAAVGEDLGIEAASSTCKRDGWRD